MKVIDKSIKQSTEIRQAGLIAAALKLAAEHSPASITTTHLAEAVGITQGAVFKHFASKEALWLATIDWVSETLMLRLRNAAATGPALVTLKAVYLTHVNFVIENPGVPRIIFQALQSPMETAIQLAVRQLMHDYRQLIVQLLTQAQADQSLAADLDIQAAVVLFIGSIQGLVMQSLVANDICSMTQQAPGVFALYLLGLQACSRPNS